MDVESPDTPDRRGFAAMSSAFSNAGNLAAAHPAGPCIRRQLPISDRLVRVLARVMAVLHDLRAQYLADISATSSHASSDARDLGAIRLASSLTRVPGDVLAGQPAVVIPLNRAVVCGEDHVYDVGQFNVCPNCAAEERLPLVALLAHERKAEVAPRTGRNLAPPPAFASANRPRARA
jgi:hypothetical protein